MKKTLKEIRDAIADLNDKFDAAKTKLDKDGAESLSKEERSALDTYVEDLRKLNEERALVEATEIRNAQRATAVAVETPGQRDVSDKEAKDFSKVKVSTAIRQLFEDGELTGLVKELDDYGRRDAKKANVNVPKTGFVMPAAIGREERGQTATGQTSAAGDQGGVYVPTEINSFIEALWSKSFLGAAGATRFADLQGNQSFPVQSTKPTVQDLTEIEAMADDEILWSQLPMSPNRRGTSIPVSRLLIIQGGLDTQSFITENLRMAMTHKMERDAITELLTLTPIALGTNGAALDWAKVVALETAVANADADLGNLHYLINTATKGKLKTTKKDDGSGIFLMDGNNELNGYSALVTNYLPSNLTKGSASGVCSAGVFGNFRDLYVGMWGGLVFDVERVPKKDLYDITVNGYWDVEVARAASFATYKDILTA